MRLDINYKTRGLLQDHCEELAELLELEADKQKLKEVTERRKRQKQAEKDYRKGYYNENVEKIVERVERYAREHPEKRRKWSKKYRATHREKTREYYEQNKARIIEGNYRRRRENPEQRKEWDKKYREEHPDRRKESTKLYREKNREKLRAYGRERYRRKKAEQAKACKDI